MLGRQPFIALLAGTFVLLTSLPGRAVTTCKVRVGSKDGTIDVSAPGLSGPLPSNLTRPVTNGWAAGSVSGNAIVGDFESP